MKLIAETPRLVLRELDFSDEKDLFEMDSDPAVHLYIENKPVESIAEVTAVIKMLKQQYKENGVARWAVINKETNECIGWAGLKYYREPLNNRINFYELGYRFKTKHWGKGYASESSRAILDYAFQQLKIDIVFAITDPDNTKSKNVLTKLGFELTETFDYDGDITDWFELKKGQYRS